MCRPVSSGDCCHELARGSGDSVVRLDEVPCWTDVEFKLLCESENCGYVDLCVKDPLGEVLSGDESGGNGTVSRFPVNEGINSKIYLWRGDPWNLEVDAVVNSTNENLDEAHSSPGLQVAAGPGLAEECATLGGCRTGMSKVTNA